MPDDPHPSVYRCAGCGRTLRFGDHDRAALDAARLCAGTDDIATVCDPCFAALMDELGLTIPTPALH